MSVNGDVKTESAPQHSNPPAAAEEVPTKPQTMAARSHKYICYEAALQPRPQDDVEFYLDKYQRRDEFVEIPAEAQTPPLTLREDFSGSGMVSIQWIKSNPERQAWAVDIDPEVFEWARTRHFPKIEDAVKERLRLKEMDVLKIPQSDIPSVDVVCANNFSWQCFKDEDAIEKYFRVVFNGLNGGGIFVMDIFGGTDTHSESRELISDHDITLSDGEAGEFSYIYEQLKVDPVTRHMDIAVSFDFNDGSSLQHAFYYQWRVWGYTDVYAKLRGVGFRSVQIFRDWSDDDGHYRHGTTPLSLEEWGTLVREDKYQSAYVVAFK